MSVLESLFIYTALELVAGQIAERGVRIVITQEPIMLYGDRLRLTEIYQNFLDNAVKFMGDQKEPLIEIGAIEKDRETICFVRDNGMGIDLRYKDKMFGLFEKLNPEMKGTGIGLALVKRIVEVHGGRIWVESEGLGKGACFYFTLLRKSSE
ncbi:MAG: ATP-binding protein [Verrucomicrobia bacterium]|nr:ATP-binding protein [Verrucomicrobiota bacterium]